MWVGGAELREVAGALRTAHGQLTHPVPAAARAVDAAAWECGAGDEQRHQVGVVLRGAADADGVLAACAVAAHHVAREADELLEAMRVAREDQLDDIQDLIREQTASGGSPGALRAELNDVPTVPALSWLSVVPAPEPPSLNVPEASALLPDTSSPAGRFSVELAALEAVPAALRAASTAVDQARLSQSTATSTPLRETDPWGLGGGQLVEPIERAFDVSLAHAAATLTGLAEQTSVAAARLRRCNTNAERLKMFGTAASFTAIAGELRALRAAMSSPSLDLDARTLQLQLARDAGLAPADYKMVLRDYWFLTAAKNAGIDVDSWDITKGAFANADTIEKVYAYYGSLFMQNPELQWAGLANMVGGGFAAAFYDLDLMGQIAEAASHIPNSPVGPLDDLSAYELQFYETTFLSMQRQIFEDIGGMHQAFVDGGMGNIDEMYAAGLVDSRTYQAWADVDAYSRMDPDDPAAKALISGANYALANREQGIVIGDDYDKMRNHLPSGQAFTYLAGLIGTPSVPGAQSPAQYDPLIVHDVPIADADIGLPDVPFVDVPFWDDAHVDVYTVDADVTTPLPRTNVSVFEDRMDLLRNDTLPAYEQLLEERGVDGLVADGLLSDDPAVVRARIEEYRLQNRLPEILGQLANWDVDVDAGFGG